MHILGIGIGEILVLGGLAGMAGTAVLVAAAVLVAMDARRHKARVNHAGEGGG